MAVHSTLMNVRQQSACDWSMTPVWFCACMQSSPPSHWADLRDGTANTGDPTISMLHILCVIIIIIFIILAFSQYQPALCKDWISQLFKLFRLLTSTCFCSIRFPSQILNNRVSKNVAAYLVNWVSEQINANETCMCHKKVECIGIPLRFFRIAS